MQDRREGPVERLGRAHTGPGDDEHDRASPDPPGSAHGGLNQRIQIRARWSTPCTSIVGHEYRQPGDTRVRRGGTGRDVIGRRRKRGRVVGHARPLHIPRGSGAGGARVGYIRSCQSFASGRGLSLALLTLSRAAAGQEHEHGSGSAGAPRHGQLRHVLLARPRSRSSIARWRSSTRSSSRRPSRPSRPPRATDPSCGIAYWGMALGSWGNPFAAGQKAPAQIRQGQDAIERANRAGAKTERERGYIAAVAELYRDPDRRDQQHAGARLPRRDGGAGGEPCRRHGGLDLLRARARAGGAAHGQDLRRPAEGGRHPGAAVRHAPRPPGARALHHPQLRRAAARAAGARRRAALRADRALGAPRAAHAVAHVHAPGLLAGVDRDEHRLGRGREARRRHRRGAARDRLPDLRVPADRPGRGGEAATRLAARDRGALRSGRGRLRRSRRGRRLRAGRDSRALGARAPRMGRGREARAAPEPVPADGGDDVLRPRSRRHPASATARPRGPQSTRSSRSATG